MSTVLYVGGDVMQTPWYLNYAVSHALTVIGWFELPEEDQPPQWIWLDDDKISDHFDSVRERWKQRSGGGSSGSEVEQTAELEDNELLPAGLVRRR